MAPLVLVILLATGEAQDPATVALLSALNESVGAAVSVRVREVADRSEAEVLRVERELKAAAVAVLAWRDPAHLGAVVRVHAASTDSWSSRTIAFAPQDATSERGRTLGLVVAAMWVEAVPAAKRPAAPASPPAPPPPVATPPAPATSILSVPSVPSVPSSPPPAKGSRPPTVTKVHDRGTPPPSIAGPRRFAIGAAGIGSVGVGGPASAAGAALEGLAFVTKRLALRLGASWRTGPLSALPGSDTVGTAGAGCEIGLLGGDGTFSLGVRLGALAIVHRVHEDPASGPAETHDRWLPGADLRIQAGVRIGPHVAWFIAAGADVAVGTTEIRKGSDHLVVATLPAAALIGETGLRLVF